MKGTVIGDIPVKRYHNLQRFLDDFMLAREKHFEVLFDEGEYASTMVAYRVLGAAAKRGKYPIQVSYHKGRVFMTRTDM